MEFGNRQTTLILCGGQRYWGHSTLGQTWSTTCVFRNFPENFSWLVPNPYFFCTLANTQRKSDKTIPVSGRTRLDWCGCYAALWLASARGPWWHDTLRLKMRQSFVFGIFAPWAGNLRTSVHSSVFPLLVGDLVAVSFSVSDNEFTVPHSFCFLQKAPNLPNGKSRRCEYGGLARRRAAVVEKEDSRSGLRNLRSTNRSQEGRRVTRLAMKYQNVNTRDFEHHVLAQAGCQQRARCGASKSWKTSKIVR